MRICSSLSVRALLTLCLLGTGCTWRPAGDVDVAGAPRDRVASTGGDSVVEDTWFELRISDQPAGYHHEVVTRRESGQLVTLSVQEMTVRRGDVPLTSRTEVEIVEEADGSLASYRFELGVSSTRRVTRGTVRGDRLELEIDAPGGRRQLTLPHDPRARGPQWIERRALEELRDTGDSFETVTFLPEAQRSSRVVISLGAPQAVEVGNRSRRLRQRDIELEALPTMEVAEWIDTEGVVWKVRHAAPGLVIESLRSTRERALRQSEAPPPEIFLASAIEPDRPLPSPETLESARYRLRLRRGDFASLDLEHALEAAGQEVEASGAPDERIVHVRRVEPGTSVPPAQDVTESLAPYLASSAMVQSDSPAIRDRARRITLDAAADGADAEDRLAVARKLCTWVNSHIRRNDMTVGFASAHETLQSGRGDCTEHAVLLTALARAAGIPARLVAGVVYHEGSFVGHLWTEVHIGRWVPLDATRPDAPVGPTHIALLNTALDDREGAGFFLDLAAVLGNLTIEILAP